jgi:hypothetical protein
MENHVTNLELSKKMKELGFPQFSQFSWVGCNGLENQPSLSHKVNKADYEKLKNPEWFFYSAYLASELGEWLPEFIEGWLMGIHKFEEWSVGDSSGSILRSKKDKNLPNAMAKMLIHLTEEGIINPKLLNNPQ